MNNETIILINEEETKEGFFTFSTSYPHHAKKIISRIGQVHMRGIRRDMDADGNIRWWEFKIPLEFLDKTRLCVKTPVAVARAKAQSEKLRGKDPFKKSAVNDMDGTNGNNSEG